jgi:hypothetical protein
MRVNRWCGFNVLRLCFPIYTLKKFANIRLVIGGHKAQRLTRSCCAFGRPDIKPSKVRMALASCPALFLCIPSHGCASEESLNLTLDA